MKTFSLVYVLLSLLACVQAALLAIDYGQENTKAVLVAPGVSLDILLSADSKRKDVSGVGLATIPNTNDLIRNYGFHATSSCIRTPSGCLTAVKSVLGKSATDPEVAIFKENHPGVEVTEVAERNTTAFEFAGTHFPVEEVVAMNLANLKKSAIEKWNEVSPNTYNAIADAVISVPGYFTQAERLALIDAANIAGLNVLSLIDDGLAAAISYAEHREFSDDKVYHIIYDMGAGSTKATLVSMSNVNDTLALEVEGYGFDRTLGGESFTAILKNLLVDKFLEQHSSIPRDELLANAKVMNRLWQSAEKAKLVLSANAETVVSIENLYDDHDFKATLTRDEFEQSASELIERSALVLDQAFGQFKFEDVSSVIMAGGSTRIPSVQKSLSSYLGSADKISKNINADEAIVFGLTLRGASLGGFRSRRTINVDARLENLFEVSDGSSKGSDLSPYNFTGGKLDLFENSQLIRQYSVNETDNDSCTAYFYIDLNSVVGVEVITCDEKPMLIDESITGPASMTDKQRKASISKLNRLDRKDKERIYREEIANSLESSLYDMRYYLEDDDVVAKSPPALVRKGQAMVDKLLVWLEEKSDTSSAKQIEKKLKELTHHKDKLDTYVNTPDELLSSESFGILCNKSTEVLSEVQDFMLTMSEDAMDMKETYDKHEVDFDETNGQMKLKMRAEFEKEVKDSIDHIREFVDRVEALMKKKEEKPRTLLVELHQEGLEAIEDLKSIYKELQRVHELRITFLEEKLKAALKKRKKADSSGSVSTESVSTESNSSETAPADSDSHDEL